MRIETARLLIRAGTEIAYHFAKKFWGRGYATEAVKAVLQYGL